MSFDMPVEQPATPRSRRHAKGLVYSTGCRRCTPSPHQWSRRRMSGYEAIIEEVRFAGDSPVEQAGFELPVPLAPVSL